MKVKTNALITTKFPRKFSISDLFVTEKICCYLMWVAKPRLATRMRLLAQLRAALQHIFKYLFLIYVYFAWFNKGSFTYYVTLILAFLDTHPTPVTFCHKYKTTHLPILCDVTL